MEITTAWLTADPMQAGNHLVQTACLPCAHRDTNTPFLGLLLHLHPSPAPQKCTHIEWLYHSVLTGPLLKKTPSGLSSMTLSAG